jgi:LPS O-antigen subunit length determinant protein (WzzB/FepE family)
MKNKIKNEINLYEVFYILFSNKFKILIITIASILIAIISEKANVNKSQSQKHTLTFSAYPIDRMEEFNYLTYNGRIKTLHSKNNIFNQTETNLNLNLRDIKSVSPFFSINSSVLYNFALDKFNSENFSTKILKKTSLFKKNNYAEEQAQINSPSLEVKMFLNKSNSNYQNLKLYDVIITSEKFDNLEKNYQFLVELEKIINLEIKHDIVSIFNSLYLSQKKFFQETTKHLKNLNSIETDQQIKKFFNFKIIELNLELKNIEDLNKLFYLTPINSENFIAVKLDFNEVPKPNLSKNKTTSMMTLVIKSTVFGILLAILFTLFYHHYFSRKKLRLKYRKNY